jgi:hypothetical protein
LKGKDHVVGREGVSIGPANAWPEVKGEGFMIGCDFPFRGEAGLYLLGDSVITNERIEKEANESARGGIFRNEGVEGGGFSGCGVDKNATSSTDFILSGIDTGGEGI